MKNNPSELNINAMVKRETENSVRLCCGGKCPIVTDIGDGNIEITDDNGNTVVMKREEAKLISDGVRMLEGQQLILG